MAKVISAKISLEDDYTSQVKKISASSGALSQALEKTGSSAKKMSQALEGAFKSKTHKVKIKDIGSKEVQSNLRKTVRSLNAMSSKTYRTRVEIVEPNKAMESITNGLDKMKTKAESLKTAFSRENLGTTLKSPFKKMGSAMLSPFKATKTKLVDISSLIKANKEARSLAKELTKLTGKKHKVSFDLQKPKTDGFFSKMKSNFSSMGKKFKSGFSGIGSKLNPFSRRGGGGGGGESSPSMMKSIVGGNLISGAISKGLGAMSSMASSTIGAGMSRLESIQSSKARLKGFGYSKEETNTISSNAMEAVKGTAYGFGDAMTASASAVAAGIKPGKDLTKHLTLIGNAAAATGADFNEMGSIFNRVATNGKLQADELNQIQDRGIALMPALQDVLKTTPDGVREMMRKGQVSFSDFQAAMEKASGTAAKEMGSTWEGAKANFKASLGRVGANLLGGSDNESGVFGALTPALMKVTEALGPLEAKAGQVGDALGKKFAKGLDIAMKGFDKLKDLGGVFQEKFEPVFEVFGKIGSKISEVFSTAFEGLGDGLLEGVITIVAEALTFLGNVVLTLTPYLEQLGSFVSTYVVPALQMMGAWIMENVGPAFQALSEWVAAYVLPAFDSIATVITDVVWPVFETLGEIILAAAVPALTFLAELVGGAVTFAFKAVKAIADGVASAFSRVKGAVEGAIGALVSLPGRIAGSIKGKIEKITGHATGTEYFAGGMSQINERGEEMMKLPRGTKIYPAGKTDRIIKQDMRKTTDNSKTERTSNITINVNGANMTNKDVARAISNELRRLGVVV